MDSAGVVAAVNALMTELKLDKRCELKSLIVRYSQKLTAEFGEKAVDEYFSESFLPRLKKFIHEDDLRTDLSGEESAKAVKALNEWTQEELQNGSIAISRMTGKLLKRTLEDSQDDGLHKKKKYDDGYMSVSESSKLRPADIRGGWIEMEKFKNIKGYGELARDLMKPAERLNHGRQWAQEFVGPLYNCDLVTYTNAQNSITLMCKAHQLKSKVPGCNLFVKVTVVQDNDSYHFTVKKKGQMCHEVTGTNSGKVDEHCQSTEAAAAAAADTTNEQPMLQNASAAGTEEHEVANVLAGNSASAIPPPPPPLPQSPPALGPSAAASSNNAKPIAEFN